MHLGDGVAVGLEGHQAAGVRAEGGFPQLVRVHFTEALEAGDGDLVFLDAFFGELVQRLLLFGFIEAIDFARVALGLDIDAEQRRLRDVDVALFDQRREVLEEEGEQQHLDVRAIDVGVGHHDDAAVAQAGDIDAVDLVNAVRIDADGYRNVVHLVVLEQLVALDFPGVQHLAAQGQHGLGFLVAALLGGAAGRIALDQEDFVAGDVVRFAVGQLAGQGGDAGRFLLLDLLGRFHAVLRGLDRQFGDLLAEIGMAVQPQLEGVAHHLGDQLVSVARGQFFLGLALELRVEHLGREQVGHLAANVFLRQLHFRRQDGVVFGKGLDRFENAGFQPGFVGAAVQRRDQVDVAFRLAAAFLEPGQRPGGAFADREAVFDCDIFLANEDRRHRLANHHFAEVIGHAVLVAPDFLVLPFDVQLDGDVGHQHGLRAQQMLQLAEIDLRRIEILGVG